VQKEWYDVCAVILDNGEYDGVGHAYAFALINGNWQYDQEGAFPSNKEEIDAVAKLDLVFLQRKHILVPWYRNAEWVFWPSRWIW
jgi:hypothetical protein